MNYCPEGTPPGGVGPPYPTAVMVRIMILKYLYTSATSRWNTNCLTA
jgi:hypothetical protein